MFYAILLSMVIGDAAWWFAAHRRLSRRSLRVLAGLFAAGQLLGLFMIIVGRMYFPSVEQFVPRWIFSIILFWHLLLLLPWMVWQAARGISGFARWLTRKLADQPAPQTSRVDPAEGPLTRRQFLGATAAFTPPLIAIGAGFVGEWQLEEFRVRKLTLDLPNLPSALDGLTIAHVTDVHVGRLTRGKLLERIVEETNRLNADVVALTGDLINDSLRALPAALDMVKGFRARRMVVSCEGNHDLIDNPHIFYRESERGGLPLLRGETADFQLNGQKVQVLGLPWSRNHDRMADQMKQLLAKRDSSAWPLLLAHHPHAWDTAEGIPLTLAGHTHGGQLMINPHVGFGSWMFRYWSGHYRRQSGSLVVSNGVGNWFPVRIQAPAEIIHLTLRKTA